MATQSAGPALERRVAYLTEAAQPFPVPLDHAHPGDRITTFGREVATTRRWLADKYEDKGLRAAAPACSTGRSRSSVAVASVRRRRVVEIRPQPVRSRLACDHPSRCCRGGVT